jgi:ABC-type nitrate/sulfonate/bicarbonate transport system substrate-binding protein
VRRKSISLRAASAVLSCAVALLAAGCGADDEAAAPNRGATLLLDGRPDAVHAGIYTAVQRDYDGALGLELRVAVPTRRTRGAAELARGRADLAVLDVHELARARERGRDLVGVMALVQRPVRRPRPGAPPYPELVLAVTRETLQDLPALVRATAAAVARGYEEVAIDPEGGVRDLVEGAPGTDRAREQRRLDRISPAFTAGARAFGQLDPARLRRWAAWARRAGLVGRTPDVALAFDGRYVPAPGRD